MVGMKGDMGGAAAVLGTFRAVATLGAKVNLVGYIPLTDNMPGPDATRVGDVLKMRNGKTVEVLNTDAEGRLILADALSLATEGAPDAIVDLATLTGACMVALGDRTAGLMGNHQGWLAQVQGAADTTGEPMWPLPLPTYLRGKLDSTIADLKNITDARWGGALAAGVFLQEFVGEGIPWAHIDIAGPADSSEVDGAIVKGGPGSGGGRHHRGAGVAAAPAHRPAGQARQHDRRPEEHHRRPLGRRAGGRGVPAGVRRRGHPVGPQRHRRPGRLLRGRRRHRQGRHRLRRPHPRRAAQHLREAPQGPALTPASNGVRHHSTRPGGGTLRRSPYPARKLRSEERRVRTECFSTCSSRWSPYHLTKNTIQLSKPLT